ncbi:MAG TPA: PilN domain-containing protein [Gemmatimonadaceae bacterium]|jgi:Tfp pilus assembly protein PilN|nr:PilN domain-containing protein [Gemmatimonadaceae bacterium]
MIEINLLPGGGKKGRAKSGVALGASFSGLGQRIKNPYLVTAVSSLAIALLSVGGLHFTQQAEATELGVREESALRDSARYGAVLAERRKLEARRDSVVKQLEIIKSIDNDRFVWPHVMDEVSRALPPYTWLKSMSTITLQDTPQQPGKPDDKAAKETEKEKAKQDPMPSAPLRFKIVGHTVDIQALTRFMKLLETSPFVQKVQLSKSELVVVEGKEVTEFTLEAEYERPTPDAIVTAPVSLSVR